MSGVTDRSPTWSVYDGLWESNFGPRGDGASSPPFVPLVSAPLDSMTLKGCGLRKKELLSCGAQGAVYAAYDPALSPEEGGDEENREAGSSSKGRLVAVKRLFLQSNDFGARGVAETVLREATILSFVHRQQEQQECQGETDSTRGNGAPTAFRLDSSARVVGFYRIVEAPHRELCLELEHCPLDLSRLVLESRRDRPGPHQLGMALAYTAHLSLEDDDDEEGDRERAPPGSVADLTSGPFPLSVVKFLLRRLLRLLGFLHEHCGVMHRDLKPSNVLVTAGGELRLSDLGSARFLKADHEEEDAEGEEGNDGAKGSSSGGNNDRAGAYTPAAMRTTRLYQAPECLLGTHGYTAAMEVWSAGVIFAELLRRRHLFAGDSELSLLGAIWKLLGPPTAKGEQSPSNGGSGACAAAPPSFEPSSASRQQQATLPLKFSAAVVPAEGLDLLRRMLAIRPEDRISVRDALAHPFLSAGESEAAEDSSLAEDGDASAAAAWRCIVAATLAKEAATVSVRMPSLQEQLYGAAGGLMGGQGLGFPGMGMMMGGGPQPGRSLDLGLDNYDDEAWDEDEESKRPVFWRNR